MPAKSSLTCAHCGATFSVYPNRLKENPRFCSIACKAEGQRRPLAERFWKKVDQRADDECWPWTAAHNQLGYGVIRENGRNLFAHRVAYELTFGPIPEGLVICHVCDNGECCNPMHLWAGTMRENTEDMLVKGRARGPQRKVSAEQVRELRRRHAAGERQYHLAAEFGISRGHVSEIIHRKERVWD
jgi:hypothetical protein